MVVILMSEKLATPGFLEIKIFRNKSYDLIIHGHDVIGKILSCDVNHIVVGVT